ncbi:MULTISPECIES: ABC transporter ATP-binding protein [unclassified Adlercreutzia]|uniref:ABC transporter ATP-binding protein n=1 Tax=unclassified Adlercreutzia TaxID=2636013 RepID=UPI0013EC489D|nr:MULTISPECIES: ABC transporter ATP-binding protein [unclassified Adlercreutzia]
MNDIVVDNLSFAYPETDRLILNNVHMKVNAGDFVCLLGQSGCGKSTFLRLLAGLEKPTSGSISVGGQQVRGTSLTRSVVFQDYGLFPWMSSGENIVLALRQRYPEKSKRECRDMALAAIQSVGLSADVYDKFPKELSGGMKQRCAIARSFSMNPPILLMDEPFGALDAVTRARLQDMVLDLWSHEEQKKTVFFVTHDVEEALLLATRIYVFGQSPSQIIFEKELPAETKPDRKGMYESEQIIELRNELVQYINQDVLSHVEE